MPTPEFADAGLADLLEPDADPSRERDSGIRGLGPQAASLPARDTWDDEATRVYQPGGVPMAPVHLTQLKPRVPVGVPVLLPPNPRPAALAYGQTANRARRSVPPPVPRALADAPAESAAIGASATAMSAPPALDFKPIESAAFPLGALPAPTYLPQATHVDSGRDGRSRGLLVAALGAAALVGGAVGWVIGWWPAGRLDAPPTDAALSALRAASAEPTPAPSNASAGVDVQLAPPEPELAEAAHPSVMMFASEHERAAPSAPGSARAEQGTATASPAARRATSRSINPSTAPATTDEPVVVDREGGGGPTAQHVRESGAPTTERAIVPALTLPAELEPLDNPGAAAMAPPARSQPEGAQPEDGLLRAL